MFSTDFPCYSTGKFYGGLEKPFIKMDKTPQTEGVIKNDLVKDGLPQADTTISSIVFDPPFMFGKHGKTDENIMTKRFTMFDSWADLEIMYKKSLQEFKRVLIRGGIVAFKCQDYTDSRTTLTHCFVHNWALEVGFAVEDIFIMTFRGGRVWNSNLRQRHARKYHSYWFVFRNHRQP
jgi:tRNA G10  N-methylase Trm11